VIDNLSYLEETIILPTATGEIVLLGFRSISADERKLWCDWARDHGIDPGEAGWLPGDRPYRSERSGGSRST
jgi:hypothetical protein